MGGIVTTIFLDRDGVINENRPDYVKSWSEFRFLPGSREAIVMLTQAGHRLVVCTNQAAVARGTISLEALHEIHRKMLLRSSVSTSARMRKREIVPAGNPVLGCCCGLATNWAWICVGGS